MGLFKKRTATTSGGGRGSPNTVYAAGVGGVAVILAGSTRSRTITEDGMSAVAIAPEGTPEAGTVYVGVSRFDPNAGVELSPGIRMGKPNFALLAYGPDGAQRRSIAIDAQPYRILVAPAGVPNAGTLYVLDWNDDKVSMVRAGATTSSTLNTGAVLVGAVAGAGLPNAGNVYIVDQEKSKIITILPDGTFSIARDLVEGPSAVAIAPAGTTCAGAVYVANGARGVTIIRSDGVVEHTIQVDGRPNAIAIAPSHTPNAGTAYVTKWDSATVTVISPDGGAVRTIAAGAGSRAEGILVAPAGTPDAGAIYTCDSDGGTLTRIGPDGSVRNVIKVGSRPASIAVAPAGTPSAGTIYIGTDESVAVLSPGAGEVLARIGVPFGQPQLVVVP